MLTYIELLGSVFFFIWCENAVPTPLFLALHPWFKDNLLQILQRLNEVDEF